MAKKIDYSKKILKILSDRPAVLVSEILHLGAKLPSDSPKLDYAVTRSIKGLKDAGLIEKVSSGQNEYARLTQSGKKKAISIKLDNEEGLISTTWDGYWRIILLDIPENRKNEREALRYLLKKAGFMCLKNSAWVSPYPFEHLFNNIKKDFGLNTELMIFVTKNVDEETEKELYEIFRK